MAEFFFPEARIIDPRSDFHQSNAAVWIKSGRFYRIAKPSELSVPASVPRLEVPGLHLSPGWVDMEVHLSAPGHEWKESLPTLAQAAVKGGLTAVLGYPNTQPVLDNSQLIRSLQQQAVGLPVQLWLAGSLSLHGEGQDLSEAYDMSQAGALAFTEGLQAVPTAGAFLRGLQYLQGFGGLLIEYPLDESLRRGTVMHEGVQSARLGMPGLPALAEVLVVQRDLMLHAYAPGRLHFQPLTTPEAVDYLANVGPEVTAGTAIPYLICSDQDLETYDTYYKVMPPLRDIERVHKLRAALQAGKLSVLASGHRAQGPEEKQVEFAQAEPGMLGLQTLYPLIQTYLIDEGVIDLEKMVTLLSIHPREILRQPSRQIAEGEVAELSCFVPGEDFTLQPAGIPSRAKNSPFIGLPLRGRVVGTFLDGQFHRG